MRRGLQISFFQYGFYRLCNCRTNNLKLLCTHSKESTNEIESNKAMTHAEAYRQLENLDFETATKILFTAPPKQKKFGIDFHLVQLFFACLPSVAVYWVAQYARSEMKKKDEELHRKRKQAEDKERAKEAEKFAVLERTDSELGKVKARLDALEETVKEIADETKKIARSLPIHDAGGDVLKTSTGSADNHVAPSSTQNRDRAPTVTSTENSSPLSVGIKTDVPKEEHISGPSDSSKDLTPDHGLRGFAARWLGSIRSR